MYIRANVRVLLFLKEGEVDQAVKRTCVIHTPTAYTPMEYHLLVEQGEMVQVTLCTPMFYTPMECNLFESKEGVDRAVEIAYGGVR